MGTNSKIEWCHHTGNLWHGCQEVHAGCDHCYARELDKRYGGDHWNAAQAKRKPIKSVWADFTRWQKMAHAANEVHRVFVGSMMDIFELPKGLTEPLAVSSGGRTMNFVHTGEVRNWFFSNVVPLCPNLLFLLLTKRPGNINQLLPDAWKGNPPANVMFGYSAVDQEAADRDIPKLLEVNGRKFLSCEPLLGPVDLTQHFNPCSQRNAWGDKEFWFEPEIDWVIVGGESGRGARAMHIDWARDLRDLCSETEVAFFFKQNGEYEDVGPAYGIAAPSTSEMDGCVFVERDGTVRKTFEEASHNARVMQRVGKKMAGRLLDGREWNEVPDVAEVSG